MQGHELEATPSDGIIFINKFTLHAPAEEFERAFAKTSGFMESQPGFLGYRLVKHVSEEGSYVNIAFWRDTESFRQAVASPSFQPHAAALRAVSTSEHNLYTLRQAVLARHPSL